MNQTFKPLEHKSNVYLVGIDLGTSNSAVFYLNQDAVTQKLQHFQIPQWVDFGQWHAQDVLPSHLYYLSEEEQNSKTITSPWSKSASSLVVGEWAKQQQPQNPARHITSAKSWLAYHHIDPHSKVLPQHAEESQTRFSPIEVTTEYLKHIKHAWNHTIAAKNEDHRLEHQNIVITVPASFDAAARQYTLEAADRAGLKSIKLLEEPQSAFYAWVAEATKRQIQAFQEQHLILVIDVGGGTTDMSLIEMKVQDKDGTKQPTFQRVAVSDHLLLGGDNIDLSLAAYVESQLNPSSKKLSIKHWQSLVGEVRHAKEALLSGEHESLPITLLHSGSSLLGKTKTFSLSKGVVENHVLDGFFPKLSWDDELELQKPHGLRQMGLPYAQETAITKHLCHFLKRYSEEGSDVRFPDVVLFNGGTLVPKVLQKRLEQQLKAWQKELTQKADTPASKLKTLNNKSLSLAVAKGAAYFHKAAAGQGFYISGGSARSYYVQLNVVEADSTSNTSRWLCVLPQNVSTHEPLSFPEVKLSLNIQTPVQFKLISSIHHPEHQAGELISVDDVAMQEDYTELPPIETVIRVKAHQLPKKTKQTQVSLAAELTELGILRLSCESEVLGTHWDLEFHIKEKHSQIKQLQNDGEVAEEMLQTSSEPLPESWKQVVELIEFYYGKRKRQQESSASKKFSLYKELEDILQKGRADWPIAWIRSLWDLLYEGHRYRTRSASHELNWLRLCGFCMRPGFGYAGDELRMQQFLSLLEEGIYFKSDTNIQNEWWIMCRRLAGGISASQQQQLFKKYQSQLKPTTSQRSVASKKRFSTKKKKVSRSSTASIPRELLRMLASFENILLQDKQRLGELLIQNIKKQQISGAEGWCLARLGSRVPAYGAAVHLLPAGVVASWAKWLLTLKGVAFQQEIPRILFQLSQKTGQRELDLPKVLIDRIHKHLKQHQPSLLEQGSHSAQNPLQSSQEEAWVFGEALPLGLSIHLEVSA